MEREAKSKSFKNQLIQKDLRECTFKPQVIHHADKENMDPNIGSQEKLK
jgi:hypothetical protein